MKNIKIYTLMILVAMTILLTGCTSSDKKVESNNTKTNNTSVKFDEPIESKIAKAPKVDIAKVEISKSKEDGIDYEILGNDGESSYSAAYKLVSNPSSYFNKNLKIEGEFWYNTNHRDGIKTPNITVKDIMFNREINLRLDFSNTKIEMDEEKCLSLDGKKILIEGVFSDVALKEGYEFCIKLNEFEVINK